eukprot:c16939_g1_i1 orf=237-536(+)
MLPGCREKGNKNVHPTYSLETQSFPPVALSSRTRENSFMSLKQIFDQLNSSAKSALQNLSLAGKSRRGEDRKRVVVGTTKNTAIADKKTGIVSSLKDFG